MMILLLIIMVMLVFILASALAMAVAPLMQMAMDPNVQKSAKSVIKYLLIFGSVGVAIILFIFLGKKFDPIKKITDWFKNKLGGGIIGSVGKGLASAFGLGGIGGAGGLITSAVGGTVEPLKSPEEMRREFERLSVEASRKVGLLKNDIKVSEPIRVNASIIQSAFKKVASSTSSSKPTVAEVFASTIKRATEVKKPEIKLPTIKKSSSKKKKGWF